MDDKKKVLFICTHNSARSHMAEGFMNALHGDHYAAWSAGTDPSDLNPTAVKVMGEVGIDLSAHHSKGLEGFLDREWDYVVTVCDNAPSFREVKSGFTRAFKTLPVSREAMKKN